MDEVEMEGLKPAGGKDGKEELAVCIQISFSQRIRRPVSGG
jgi:hypothetical protein